MEGVCLQIEMLVGGLYGGIADQHAAFPSPTGRDAAALPEQYDRIGLHQNTTAHLGKEAQIMTGVVPWEQGAALQTIVSSGKPAERAVCDDGLSAKTNLFPHLRKMSMA